ncbi:hypothetical protein T492DRAFT_879547, partial [Pavlovales sp. CCMP2436]
KLVVAAKRRQLRVTFDKVFVKGQTKLLKFDETGEELRLILKCSHAFCQCLDEWLLTSWHDALKYKEEERLITAGAMKKKFTEPTCPTCRHQLKMIPSAEATIKSIIAPPQTFNPAATSNVAAVAAAAELAERVATQRAAAERAQAVSDRSAAERAAAVRADALVS